MPLLSACLITSPQQAQYYSLGESVNGAAMPNGKVRDWAGYLSAAGKGISNVSRIRNSEVDSMCVLRERRERSIGSLSRHGLQFVAIAGGS